MRVRIHGVIASASIVLLVFSGFAYHRTVARARRAADPMKTIAEQKARFVKGRALELAIDPSERGSLLNPALALPSTHLLPFSEIRALYRYADGCDARELAVVVAPEL